MFSLVETRGRSERRKGYEHDCNNGTEDGYLIFRSVFMPRFLGVLVVLSGFGYLTLVSPSLANYLFPYYLAPDAIGEPLLLLWLLVMGVNPQCWKEQAGAAGASLRA